MPASYKTVTRPSSLSLSEKQVIAKTGSLPCCTNASTAFPISSSTTIFSCGISVKEKRTARSFAYVPHPVVPHENSNFKSSAAITIGENSQIIISEIITCGRKHSGEVFKLKRFQNLTKIYHQNKLVVKDNVLIQPDLIPISSIGILENYTHQGSFIFFSTKSETDKVALVETLLETAKKHTNVEIGISVLDGNGFVIRALSQGGEAMYNYFLAAQDLLWEL